MDATPPVASLRRARARPLGSRLVLVEHLGRARRRVAQLLDPNEFELIEKATKTSRVFADLADGRGGATRATLDEPGTVVSALVQNPETDAVLSAAQTMLDFKTEAARIKSIIDPRLADHVRQVALKFVDELKRAV